MEEIVAFMNFVDYFTAQFGQSSSCYDFSMTDLRTKILNLAAREDNLLIFYLHRPSDEFSLNFCYFLQDPDIEAAFKNENYILYCWDIESDGLKPKLMDSFREQLGDGHSHYIRQNRSAVLVIKWDNNTASVLDAYDDAIDLARLRGLLVRESLEETVITPLSYQQLMATCFGDRDYTSFEITEHDLLKKDIGYALYGPPMEKGENETAVYNPEQHKEIEKLFSQILKENNSFCKWYGRIVISFIYVCAETLEEDKLKKAKKCLKTNEKYNPDADFIPYPVFVLRKCKHNEPARACRSIIDHEGRVYQTWDDYLKNNRLPPCKMLYPKDGRYCSDKDVEFNSRLSPACDLTKKIGKVSDIGSGVAGLAAGGVSLAASTPAILAAAPAIAAAAPIALPVAAAVGIGTGIYAVGRSIYNLVDRSKYKQNIGLSDSESRAAFLNIAGGVMSAGVFGAARTVSLLASRGVQVGQGTRYILYGINGVNLAVNGIGIGNNVYEAYRSRNASPLLIAQISASILFFANAVYNFRAVANIIEESQGKALNEIESSLRSNRHRNTFKKLLKESIRTQGETQGKASVIASIRNMENVDDVIATLTRSNKMLNEQGIRFSAEGGQIHLNGMPVDMTNFGGMNKMTQVSFLENFPPIPENLSPNAQFVISRDVKMWLTGIRALHGFVNNPTIEQLVREIFSAFEGFVRDFIMDISKRFFNNIDLAIVRRLTRVINDSTVKLMKWLVNQLKETDVFKKVLNREPVSSAEKMSLVDDLKGQFLCQYVNYEYDDAKTEERKEHRKTNTKGKIQQTCKICLGYYYV